MYFLSEYIKGVQENRDGCNLGEFFNQAEHEICILATNLDSLDTYREVLEAKAKEGVTVRILAMHPTFAVTFNIARVTGESSLPARWEEMKESIVHFMKRDRHYEFRLYKGIAPTLILFIVDDSCYVAHLLNGQQARNTTHFLFRDDAPGSDPNSPVLSFKKHFNKEWDDQDTEDTKLHDREEFHMLKYSAPTLP